MDKPDKDSSKWRPQHNVSKAVLGKRRSSAWMILPFWLDKHPGLSQLSLAPRSPPMSDLEWLTCSWGWTQDSSLWLSLLPWGPWSLCGNNMSMNCVENWLLGTRFCGRPRAEDGALCSLIKWIYCQYSDNPLFSFTGWTQYLGSYETNSSRRQPGWIKTNFIQILEWDASNRVQEMRVKKILGYWLSKLRKRYFSLILSQLKNKLGLFFLKTFPVKEVSLFY